MLCNLVTPRQQTQISKQGSEKVLFADQIKPMFQKSQFDRKWINNILIINCLNMPFLTIPHIIHQNIVLKISQQTTPWKYFKNN